jgi:cysteinyl-tRNA synthetase
MRVHYRAQLNFTWEGMEEARQALARIDDWLRRLHAAATDNQPVGTLRDGPTEQFEEALDNDLNISAALGFLFESIRETNRELDRGSLPAATAQTWLEWWKRVDSVLLLTSEATTLPAEIKVLAEARAQARLAKDWRKSDQLRDELSARGWEARDTKDGQKITQRSHA